jgi:hypothetical protein
MSRKTSTRPWIGLNSILAVTICAAGMAIAAETISEDAFNRCRAISDGAARLNCFENLTSQAPQIVHSSTQNAPLGAQKIPDIPQGLIFDSQSTPFSRPIAGKWRLVRTPNPQDGQNVISIMATAELSSSDLDFAGLNLRCADQDFEILVFLIRPLSPRARPAISINGKTFQGSVVSPGTAILLPRAASALAKEQWQSLPSLSIDIEDDGIKIHGLVSLASFNTALQTLVGTCLAR